MENRGEQKGQGGWVGGRGQYHMEGIIDGTWDAEEETCGGNVSCLLSCSLPWQQDDPSDLKDDSSA